jgi:hypothetical protein
MSKNVPNLRQPSTGPVVYPSIKLPPVQALHKGIDPGLAQLGRIHQPAPQPVNTPAK